MTFHSDSVENIPMTSLVRNDPSKVWLESLYRDVHRREMVSPDPLQYLYGYPDCRDREIVALLASCLAYGRVTQILKSVSMVLKILGKSPLDFIRNAKKNDFQKVFSGFRHRFAGEGHLVGLMGAITETIRTYGGLYPCFLEGYRNNDGNLVSAQISFCDVLTGKAWQDPGHLLPNPRAGSACKRLNLFFRWMVREDAVDPGGWPDIPTSRLIVPLDTHMHRIGARMGWTKRKQGNLKTAVEITDALRKFSPDDPVKYDFSLTRIGIRPDVGKQYPIPAVDPDGWHG
jgi:uncharacterized protein (TIGR02757 family)